MHRLVEFPAVPSVPTFAMANPDVHELAAAYALDALDEDDRAAFERHLASCERCVQELASFREAAASLAYAVEHTAPPAALRGRILEAARAERPNVVPFPRRYVMPALTSVAAVAAVVAIGLGVWSVSLSRSLDDERSARAATERALTLVADPNATRVPIADTDGSLVVAKDGAGALVVCGLDDAPSGKTYEAWVLERGTGTLARAGEFEGGGRCDAYRLTRLVPDGARVLVTIERDGGVDEPEGDPILRSDPA